MPMATGGVAHENLRQSRPRWSSLFDPARGHGEGISLRGVPRVDWAETTGASSARTHARNALTQRVSSIDSRRSRCSTSLSRGSQGKLGLRSTGR